MVYSKPFYNLFYRYLQQQGSATAEMERERLKLDCKRSMQMVQQWKKMYENLHQFCVNELLEGDQAGGCNGNSIWDVAGCCAFPFWSWVIMFFESALKFGGKSVNGCKTQYLFALWFYMIIFCIFHLKDSPFWII